MRLCLRCAQAGRHEAGCVDETDPPGQDAPGKQARALRGIERARSILVEANGLLARSPREALRVAWVAERTLELYPATDLETFDARRGRNDLANSVAKAREMAAAGLADGEASGLLEDLAFARRALELFAEVARRRHEAVTFDLSEFVQLPPSDRREVADALKELCLEVEKSLQGSKDLEAAVAAWGPENVPALAADRDPVSIPADKIPEERGRGALVLGAAVSGVGLALGAAATTGALPEALVAGSGPLAATAGWALGVAGLGAAAVGGKRLRASATARREAPRAHIARFHELSVQYRQRVYMSAALRILQHKATLVEKAEDAFRRFTGGDGTARWKRLCSPEGAAIVRTFFDWDPQARPLKDAVSYSVAMALGPKGRLRPFDEMAEDGWDVLLKAFLLDVFASDAGDEARFFDGIAPLIAEGALEDRALEALAVRTIEAWRAMAEGG